MKSTYDGNSSSLIETNLATMLNQCSDLIFCYMAYEIHANYETMFKTVDKSIAQGAARGADE